MAFIKHFMLAVLLVTALAIIPIFIMPLLLAAIDAVGSGIDAFVVVVTGLAVAITGAVIVSVKSIFEGARMVSPITTSQTYTAASGFAMGTVSAFFCVI